MVILLGNQKGGAGKSTLTILLANYLKLVHDLPVAVIDMDDQRSVEDHYMDAQKLENPELYEVVGSDLSHFPALYKAVFSKAPETIVIIDLPGKLDDDNLAAVFQKADLLICPFIYEKMTFKSTVLFSMVLKKINPNIKMMYVPSRIKGTVVYDTEAQVKEVLNQYGPITPPIPDKQIFQRVSTYEIPTRMYPDILPTMDMIYKEAILPFITNQDKKDGGKNG
ncbi:chromosome partitioning protein [Pedobacter antarcticus]|jgi:chromosome partitioning protein|uniref:Chromosome partitioning protein n=1 Tax=Pedobacter antarcticus TaxID=34086 RepID=A0A1I2J2F8_9SPHI|nr:ParA family protein [Pedobacter antarcticus]SFF48684.1 chromosome partitioning protein [Pedobacter antarcticus]